MKEHRLGFDIDGVLATFTNNFSSIVTRLTGITFPPDSPTWPCVWDWEVTELLEAGFSLDHIRDIQQAAWEEVQDPSTRFWQKLPPIQANVDSVRKTLAHVSTVVFITARPGISAKKQTEVWLKNHFGVVPHVEISADKGKCAVYHNLTAYIDDRAENIIDIMQQAPNTTAYLLDKPYNKHVTVPNRVGSVDEMLIMEGLYV